jgi:acetyl-CoA acetyltransferase family protein
MRFERAAMPLRGLWSSPFARWQGELSERSSLDLVVDVTTRALERRDFASADLDGIVLGWTVPQPGIFYGAPTVAARIGAPGVTGPMIAQACATSVACLQAAATAAEANPGGVQLVAVTDRTSNGPHLVYPSPSTPGGSPQTEDWVLENFRSDPWGGRSMVETAERVAADAGITREEIDDVTLLRHQQYQRSLENGREFQRSYMVEVEIPRRGQEPRLIDADSGIHATTAEGLAALKPVMPDGVVTYGAQTHPADGCAGMLVADVHRARTIDGGGIVRILATGFARVGKAEMPKAPVPAAQAALHDAGLGIDDVDAVTTHNPFAVNDLYFSEQTSYPLDRMNEYGSSLVYGHPQAPTGARLSAELVEVLRRRGGGTGLFTGCAAGDTGGAAVLRVDD